MVCQRTHATENHGFYAPVRNTEEGTMVPSASGLVGHGGRLSRVIYPVPFTSVVADGQVSMDIETRKAGSLHKPIV